MSNAINSDTHLQNKLLEISTYYLLILRLESHF